jgi:hypothetical protein
VVIPLFLVALAALVLPFVWPTKSADELYAAAQPLLASDNPDDWDAALEKYLDPLARKYPDRYKEEIALARSKVRDRRELRKALAEGAKTDPRTDAERGYLRGLRLAQAGDADAARKEWTAVTVAFGAIESERRWAELARAGLAVLDQPGARAPRGPLDREPLRKAIEHAKELATAGKRAEAVAAFDALAALTEHDPVARKMVEEARPK